MNVRGKKARNYGGAVKGPTIGLVHGQPRGFVRLGVDVDGTLGLGSEELVPDLQRSGADLALRQRFQVLRRLPEPATATSSAK